ncbi:hypothetical protein [Megaira polyxenophila phage MAnkyphage_25.80]|nr:hypothetical protein [Megaira polyxenophila phage MAnkyphage_25.80]
MSKAAVVQFPEIKKTRLYYVDKKTNKQKRLSDNIFRDLQYVTRPNDRKKRISLKARNLLTNLLQMILKNPHKEEFVDHTFLSQITEVSSSKQNARLLEQISDIIDFTYHSHIRFQEKIRAYGYVIKLTDDGYERAKNPLAFYVNLDGQKCSPNPTKMSSQVDKNVQIYKEEENPIEEINSSYAREFISEKEKIYKKEKSENETHATFAPCSLTQLEQVALTNQEEKHQSVTNCSQLTSQEEKAIELERKQRTNENTGMFAMSDLMAKVLNEPQKTEEMPEMKLEELPKLTEKEERAILLSRTLWQTFGEQRSDEIQDDYKFVEQDQQKVCIQTKEMRLNDIEKAKIRKCIQSVYGDDVTIAMQVLAPPLADPMRQANCNIPITKANSLIFKSKLLTYNMQQMFNYPVDGVVKVIEAHGKIIVDTVAFLIERMTAPGAIDDLEQAVVETGLTLELHTRRVNHEYKNFQKDAIVLTPEKILKDREWLENHKKSLQEGKNGI